MSLQETSSYSGVINQENSAKEIKLSLSKDSKMVLMGNSYVTSLENEDTQNSNIDLNGYKLYVDGKEINVQETSQEEAMVVDESIQEENKEMIKYIIIGISVVVFLFIIVYMVIKKTKRTI